MNDTPRTDAECERIRKELSDACVSGNWTAPVSAISAVFGRQLERELNAANRQIEQLLETFKHTHVSWSGVDDSCKQCGLDLSNPIHL